LLPIVERFNGILFYPSVYEGFEFSPNVRPLLGKSREDGTLDIVWRSPSVVKPDPYLVSYARSLNRRRNHER